MTLSDIATHLHIDRVSLPMRLALVEMLVHETLRQVPRGWTSATGQIHRRETIRALIKANLAQLVNADWHPHAKPRVRLTERGTLKARKALLDLVAAADRIVADLEAVWLVPEAPAEGVPTLMERLAALGPMAKTTETTD